MKKISKKAKRIIICLFAFCVLFACAPFVINAVVVSATSDYYLTPEEAAELDVDCILVLGALVRPDGTLSHMLEDRVKRGVELYELNASERILMSGDHGRDGYDEVNAMKDFAVDMGVNADVIFMDHAGFSTYESVYRAKDIFQVEKMIVVTQEYHLYRAMYTARRLGIEVYGVKADYRGYGNMYYHNLREFLARNKAFLDCLFKPEPTYLGEAIPIWGSGNQTDDRV